VSRITASHAGALVRFSDLFPCHGRLTIVDPVGLNRPLALAGLLVVGCRAGLVLVFAIPAGSGFRSLPLQRAFADPFIVGRSSRSSGRID